MTEITTREKEAIQNVIDMYLADERRDCESWLIDEYGNHAVEAEYINDSVMTATHIYSSLRILEQLLTRINTEK